MDDSRKELCKKLSKTYELYIKTGLEKAKKAQTEEEERKAMASFTRESNVAIKNLIKREESQIALRPLLPKACYMPPPEKPSTYGCNTEKDVMLTGLYGFLMYFAIIFLVIGVIISYIFDASDFALRALILITVALILPWIIKGRKQAQIVNYEQCSLEYEAQLREWENQLNTSMTDYVRTSFAKSCCDFDSSFLSFVRGTDALIKSYINGYHERKHMLRLKYEKKKNDIDAELARLYKELEEIGILTPTYYYLAMDVCQVLENGRGDTLKEALNIAIDDERKEKEAEERRQEARRREEILRDQAEEERRHNAAMEREAREQSEAARKMQEENERHNRETEKSAREQRNKTYSTNMCSYCAYSGSCPKLNVRRTGTCGAFKPR